MSYDLYRLGVWHIIPVGFGWKEKGGVSGKLHWAGRNSS